MLIDIPKDVTANKTEYQKKEIRPVVPSENVCEEDIENAVKMIKKSKKPYIFIGGGAVLSGASEEIRTFVKKVDAPVTDSLMGKEHSREPIHYIQECLACTEPKQPITESANVIFSSYLAQDSVTA